MAGTPIVDVVEFTDPVCSWAWGTEPKLRLLRWRHGDRLRWRRVMGGLVEDTTGGDPDFDDTARAPRLAEYWSRVSPVTGMPYPARLERVVRSSVPMGHAVKAAERQVVDPDPLGTDVAGRVLRRLREVVFVDGRPADTPERLGDALATVDGLDVDQLLADLDHPDVRDAYRRDWEETRTPNDYVRTLAEDVPGAGNAKPDGDRMRYVFPTLLFRGPGGEHTVPGWKPWEAYLAALDAAAGEPLGAGRPDPEPAEALAAWELLAEREVEVLCGGAVPPGAVRWEAGGGVVYASPERAADLPVPVG